MSLTKPNLPPGWITEAINRPPKTLEELTEGAYNPFLPKPKEEDESRS